MIIISGTPTECLTCLQKLTTSPKPEDPDKYWPYGRSKPEQFHVQSCGMSQKDYEQGIERAINQEAKRMVCAHCGIQIYPSEWYEHNGNLFCNLGCLSRWEEKPAKETCAYCYGPIDDPIKAYDRNGLHFCCPHCADRFDYKPNSPLSPDQDKNTSDDTRKLSQDEIRAIFSGYGLGPEEIAEIIGRMA